MFAPCILVICHHQGDEPSPFAASRGDRFGALLRGREQDETPRRTMLNRDHKEKVVKRIRARQPHPESMSGRRLLPNIQRYTLERSCH